MLTAKSFIVAAAAAFAVAQLVEAKQASNLKITITTKHHDDKPCQPGYTDVSVEGVNGRFCAKDQICVADIKTGSCPDAQPGLEYGAYCDKVQTGVYGCKPKTKDMVDDDSSDECGEGESPMSVEGVEGIFCVKGQACVADIKDGACPGKQDGLPHGSVCGVVKTGVYGCKPAAPALRKNKSHHSSKQAAPCKAGFREVSVEGVAGVYCAKDSICAGKWGNCPTEAAPGLPYGAYCDTVKTGVLGCKPKKSWMVRKSHGKQATPCKPGFREVSVEGVAGVFCAKDSICAGKWGNCPTEAAPGLPYGAFCGTVKSGVLGCKPKTNWMMRKSHGKQAAPCKPGFREVSVEGVAGVYCAKDNICVAEVANGNCPTEAAPGMPYGAYCDRVQTGVYGCKPKTKDMVDDDSSDECGEGESPMSVEGVEGIFCVKGQACVADIKDGACPGKQDGLPHGSVCGVVKTGVYGCKPATH